MKIHSLSQSVCFTGHRSKKLVQSEEEVKHLLTTAIDDAIAVGYTDFFTGMAEGADIWAAEIVLHRKEQNNLLHLFCALPYPDFEKGRSDVEQLRYPKIIAHADEVYTLSFQYTRNCYDVRNRFMADNASLVIAAWNGTASGTKNTIAYALKKGRRVIHVLSGNFKKEPPSLSKTPFRD